MSAISNIVSGAREQNEPGSINAFYIVLMATLNSIAANQEGISAVIQKEKFLKDLFDAQNAVVTAAQQQLSELSNAEIDPNDLVAMQAQLGKITAQNATVQAEQQKLNIVQGEMSRTFGQYAQPEQKAILNACMLASGAISNHVATLRVK